MPIYLDLAKNNLSEGMQLQDGDAVAEVFNAITEVRKGQIFFARDLGFDLEDYLFRLQTPLNLFAIKSLFNSVPDLDERLSVDLNNSTFEQNEDDEQQVDIYVPYSINGVNDSRIYQRTL